MMRALTFSNSISIFNWERPIVSSGLHQYGKDANELIF